MCQVLKLYLLSQRKIVGSYPTIYPVSVNRSPLSSGGGSTGIALEELLLLMERLFSRGLGQRKIYALELYFYGVFSILLQC